MRKKCRNLNLSMFAFDVRILHPLHFYIHRKAKLVLNAMQINGLLQLHYARIPCMQFDQRSDQRNIIVM